MIKKAKVEKEERIILSPGEKIFNIINTLILGLFGLACFYPLFYVLACSISYGPAVDAGKVLLIPKSINFEAYKYVLKESAFWTAYGNTIYYTILGSMFSMLISTPAAYALSKKRFGARKIINMLLAFTMWFAPGFIPLYLNYTSLGAINSRPMMIVSFGVQAFYIILLRNYFESVPTEMEESAMIDGASDFKIFAKIYLPLSGPSLATVWLYYAMSRWNGYFWSSVLLKDLKKIPLQVYLKQKIIDQAMALEYARTVDGQLYSATTLVYALVVCSVLPVLILYPYIQKFFVKGVMVGGVKG